MQTCSMQAQNTIYQPQTLSDKTEILLTTVAAEAPGKAAAAGLRRTATEDSFMVIERCGGDVLDDGVDDTKCKL